MSSAKTEEALLTIIDEFFLKESINCAAGILVGFSGGIDSTAMLYLLSRYRKRRAESSSLVPQFPLFAHYVDHRLRSAAELEAEWRLLVANAAHFGIPLSRSRLAMGEIDRLQLKRREGPEAAHGKSAIENLKNSDGWPAAAISPSDTPSTTCRRL